MDVPIWVTWLPTVNATLNAVALVLLSFGYRWIRAGQRERHKRAMLSAFAVSTAFLACYLVYHAALTHYTGRGSKAFPATGWLRAAYLGILVSHIVLAAAVPLLAGLTIFWAWRGRWQQHRRIARWTFPIWVYVSVTGVIIYVLAYHVAPAL